MEEKLSGIVLSSINYGENDKILNIFTLEKGTVSAKIKGVKRAGAKLKFASEPFCFAEFVFSTTGDRRTVIGASLIESFYSIREDIIKFYSAGAVLEFVKHFEKEDIVSSELFICTVEALKNIAFSSGKPEAVLAQFLVKGLKIVGYGLNLDGCFNCGKKIAGKAFFDYFYGGFFCEECKNEHAREINLDTLFALKTVEKGQVDGDYFFAGALRLLNFYLINRTEEKLNSLIELIKILK